MASIELSIEEREKLKECLRREFVFFVKPSNVLPYFGKYSTEVLTPTDKSKILAVTAGQGDHHGSYQLLEDISRYRGWLKCLLDVLRDPQVKLGHAATRMEKSICDAGLQHALNQNCDVMCLDPQQTVPKDVQSDQGNHQNLQKCATGDCAQPCGKVNLTVPPGNIDILLLGNTGTGKSSTGNSILGKKVFKANCGVTSVTNSFQCETSEFNGRTFKVVDSPAINGDIFMRGDDLEFGVNFFKEAMAINPEGYHAFGLVFRFGGRFTAEDLKTIGLLKGMFGEDFVKNFCILVISCGDNFEEFEEYASLEDWCYEQVGRFKDVMNECGGRVALFDNKTKDTDKWSHQRQRLIKIIDHMCVQRLRYGQESYRQAQRERHRLVVESQEPMIREDSVEKASMIIQHLGEIQLEVPEMQLVKLTDVQRRVDSLWENVKSQDKDTGVLQGILKNIGNIRRIVEEQIKSATAAIKLREEREKNAKAMDEMRAAMDKMSQKR